MIYLTKGQPLFDNQGFVVYDPTGYYNDGDTVICASIGTPEDPACRYEARYIAYGGMVYSISDPDQLLAEIQKLDPQSLFGKDSKQVSVDQMADQIVPQSSSDTAPPTTEPVAPPSADAAPDTAATSTPEVPDDSVFGQALSQPPSSPADTIDPASALDASSTTPDLSVSSTTPALDATTTPQ